MGPLQKSVELSQFVLSLGIQSHSLKKYFFDFLQLFGNSITLNRQLQKLKPNLSKPLEDKAALKAHGCWLGT